MIIKNTVAIVLAAGRGTRMQAKTKNKVAFKLGGKPMVTRTVENITESGISEIIVVVGFQSESVRRALGNTVKYSTQQEPLGTGNAVAVAIPQISEDIQTVLSVSGDDSAFYPPALYRQMITRQQELDCDLLFLTIHKDNPMGLGRIKRDSKGNLLAIVEEKSASTQEKEIQEINTGFYCFKKDFLIQYIGDIQKNPISGEYYLTDMVEIALKAGKKVEAHYVKDDSIWYGVNNRADLAKAQKKARL